MTTQWTCPACQGKVEIEAGRTVQACPYCGVSATVPETSALDERLAKMKKPKQKYDAIQEVLRVSPNDFAANRALLYHGRLHEPLIVKSKIDYSIIPAYLLSVFSDPCPFSETVRPAKLQELLHSPQLQKTMALAEEPAAFFGQYLGKLASVYIDLFLKGDSRIAKIGFGFPKSQDALQRACAAPLLAMLAQMDKDPEVTQQERVALAAAIRSAFRNAFSGQELLPCD